MKSYHILDIGCGYGTLLAQARNRRAGAVGITISEPQAQHCQRRGLDARLLNYRNTPQDWNGIFTGVVANGSPEHFVQIEDVMKGRVDNVYREMFEIVRRIVQPGYWFVTTAIHFREPNQADPNEIAKGPYQLPRGSDARNFSWTLRQIFGGWLPEPGQFERCTDGLFKLVRKVDGTHNYHLTSEYWLKAARLSLLTPTAWAFIISKLLTKRKATIDMFRYIPTST